MNKGKILVALFMGMGSLWAGAAADYLANMDVASRENAVIDVEWAGEPTEAMHEAEFLWNTGRYDEAISAIRALEAGHGDMAVGISWREPIPTDSPQWGTDVRVSPITISITGNPELVLANNGNLFIVAKGDSSGTGCWWSFMSTDGGASWAETYRWPLGLGLSVYDVDAAEYDQYVYVAYGAEDQPNNARIRRLNASDGTVDNGFGYKTVVSGSGQIKEVNAEPNRYSGSQLYYFAIDASGNLYYLYSNDDGNTWNDASPGISNADRGLDVDYGYMSGAGHNLWASYIDTNDSLCVYGSVGYHQDLTQTNNSYAITAIAHHGDTILVASTERVSGDNMNVIYYITYNDGANWSLGHPVGTSDSTNHPDVTARGNQGWQMAYIEYHPSGPELIGYTHRAYPGPGSWDAPVFISEHDGYRWYRPSIDYLGSPGAYGVVYVDDNHVMWFDRMDWTDVAENAPRPLPLELKALSGPGGTAISFVLPEKGPVSLKIYDVKGALVEDLSGNYPRGLNRVQFATPGAGTFFAILKAGDEVARTKFISTR